ncbi:MAG TPA: iron ABC transporter permease [Patescibacteria group bacterium]|nr:iron ABC transporter permease [Patescibacteria group bacterium]
MDTEISLSTNELYKEMSARKLLWVATLAAVCGITLLTDVLVGPAWLTVPEVMSAIFTPGSSDPAAQVIVWTLRLPAALMAIVVGATLGIAGAEMQTILDNPLASPYTLGVSSGAGFGAALAIVWGAGVFPGFDEYLVSLNSFIFACLTCFLIYLIGRVRQVNAETMILAGIGLLFLFHSLLALLQYLATPEALQGIVFWLFGSLMKTTWPKLGIVTFALLLAIPLLIKDSWELTALKLGDDKAKSLGIDVERLRLKTFLLVSLLTASAVCFVGTIGFIGLVGPHIARMLVGEDQRYFLPMAALSGAVLLSAASIGSKIIIPGAIFPIGIVTSLIGVPFFFSLILSKKRGY